MNTDTHSSRFHWNNKLVTQMCGQLINTASSILLIDSRLYWIIIKCKTYRNWQFSVDWCTDKRTWAKISSDPFDYSPQWSAKLLCYVNDCPELLFLAHILGQLFGHPFSKHTIRQSVCPCYNFHVFCTIRSIVYAEWKVIVVIVKNVKETM